MVVEHWPSTPVFIKEVEFQAVTLSSNMLSVGLLHPELATQIIWLVTALSLCNLYGTHTDFHAEWAGIGGCDKTVSKMYRSVLHSKINNPDFNFITNNSHLILTASPGSMLPPIFSSKNVNAIANSLSEDSKCNRWNVSPTIFEN